MQTMDATTLGLDVAAIDERLAAGLNLPAHCYLDQHVFDFEMQAIFDRSWQYFAPRERLTEPGTVRTGQVGRVPIIVARGQDGELRGFVNVCRHRGFTLVDEDKQCSRIQCAYHTWTYALDGALVRTPRTDGIGEDPATLGLLPVSVEEWGQGVYVNPDPEALPMAQFHGRLNDMQAMTGLDLDPGNWSWVGRYSHDQDANWKLWYDNGTECYHCPTVHRTSFGSAYDVTSPDSYKQWFWESMYSGTFDPTSGGKADVQGSGYRSVQLFPGNQYVQQDGFTVLGRAIPNGPASTTFVVDYYAEEGTSDDDVEEWTKLWNQTYDEDARIVEEVQRNLASGRVTEMRYIPKLEDASRFMHGLVWDAYRAALGV